MNKFRSALVSPAERECWLSTLRLATQEVFELMLACPLEVPSGPPREQGLDVTSMVGLAGPLSGILTVRCSTKSAAKMASRMLGVDSENAGAQMWDAVGEICNMVAGNFKNKISGLGDACVLSAPTVIRGADPSFLSEADHEIHTVLLFEGEPLVLALELSN